MTREFYVTELKKLYSRMSFAFLTIFVYYYKPFVIAEFCDKEYILGIELEYSICSTLMQMYIFYNSKIHIIFKLIQFHQLHNI